MSKEQRVREESRLILAALEFLDSKEFKDAMEPALKEAHKALICPSQRSKE